MVKGLRANNLPIIGCKTPEPMVGWTTTPQNATWDPYDFSKHRGSALIDPPSEDFRKANTDLLTGLSNRHFLVEFLARSIALAERKGRRIAAIHMILEGYRALREQDGQPRADAYLSHTSKHISESIREADLVARVGEDEFVVVGLEIEGRKGATTLGCRIQDAIQDANDAFGGGTWGCQMGLSMYPDHGRSASDLLEAALQEAVRFPRRPWTDLKI